MQKLGNGLGSISTLPRRLGLEAHALKGTRFGAP